MNPPTQHWRQSRHPVQLGASPSASRGTLHVTGISMPSAGAGGDIFELLPRTSRGLGFYVADMAGNGAAASFARRHVQSAFREAASAADAPGATCARINGMLCDAFGPPQFATGFYATLDPWLGRLDYCRAGHDPALLVRRDGRVLQLTEGGGILGAFAGFRYDEGRIDLREGDRLLLYTDGLSEARDAKGCELGASGVSRWLRTHRGCDAPGLGRALLHELERFTPGRLSDDVTLAVLAFDSATPCASGASAGSDRRAADPLDRDTRTLGA